MDKTRLCLALAACLALACGRKPGPASASAEPAPPALVFEGFEASASHRGALVWEAQAARATLPKLDGRARAEEVTVAYYKSGRVVSRARADRAQLDLKTYDLEAEGNVEVRAANGAQLRTPRLSWDNRRQRASSAERVTLLRGGVVLSGTGFSADRDLHDVRLLKDVRARAGGVDALRREAGSWRP